MILIVPLAVLPHPRVRVTKEASGLRVRRHAVAAVFRFPCTNCRTRQIRRDSHRYAVPVLGRAKPVNLLGCDLHIRRGIAERLCESLVEVSQVGGRNRHLLDIRVVLLGPSSRLRDVLICGVFCLAVAVLRGLFKERLDLGVLVSSDGLLGQVPDDGTHRRGALGIQLNQDGVEAIVDNSLDLQRRRRVELLSPNGELHVSIFVKHHVGVVLVEDAVLSKSLCHPGQEVRRFEVLVANDALDERGIQFLDVRLGGDILSRSQGLNLRHVVVVAGKVQLERRSHGLPTDVQPLVLKLRGNVVLDAVLNRRR